MKLEQHVIDLLPAYALGILDGDEERQVSEHVRQCTQCAGELQAYRLVADHLALAAPDVQPPARLKESILRQVGVPASERSRITEPVRSRQAQATASNWRERLAGFLYRAAPVWGALSLILIIALAATSLLLFRQVRQQAQQLNQFNVVAMVGTEAAPEARGVLISSPDGRYGTLIVDGLPKLETGKEYQLWLNKDGERASGGVFSVGRTGYGALKVDPRIPLSEYTRFGVTIEPTGGSSGPTGAKVMGGGS